MKRFLSHIRNNRGDTNVSRMTMIAVVFVVGAILLVLTTSAFRNPINRWFGKVTNDWFSHDNGMFTQSTLSKLENLGVKKGTVYAGYDEHGGYLEIHITEDKITYYMTIEGETGSFELSLQNTQVNGNIITFEDGSVFEVSSNGSTLQTYDPTGNEWYDHWTLHQQP